MKKYSLLANKIVYSSTLWKQEDDLHKVYVRKEADIIEELCDEFVYHLKGGGKFIDEKLVTSFVYKEIYGAIWTDKGLIYVAKINEKGVLVLL